MSTKATGCSVTKPTGSAMADHSDRLRYRLPDRVEAPVEVVRRTGPLGRDHGGPERVARCALLAERLALVRLDQALQDLTGAADRRLVGGDATDVEARLGVVVAVLRRQLPA